MPDMKINSDLKLAFPIRWTEKGETLEPLIWAYHTPISREVFEANYRVIAGTYKTLFEKGSGFAVATAPIIGTLALRDVARADAIANGLALEGDPSTPLLAELKRLTMVIAPGAQGYDTVPVDVALTRNIIDADEWKETEASIVFFTCGSWMATRKSKDLMNSGLAFALQGSITSLSPMAFADGLVTSMKPAISAVFEPSLVPS